MSAPRTVVLVEGESDRVALLALADRLGSDVASHGAEVVAMGGITNVRAFAERHGPHGLGQRLAGLYDVDEERHVRRGLLAAGLPVDDVEGPAGRGFHACHADLEDELVRSVGLDGVEAVIEDAGEARSLRLLAQMPAQEGWAREELVRAPAPLVAVIERATAT